MCTCDFKLLWGFLRCVSSPQLFLLKFSVIKFLMWGAYGKKLVVHGVLSWWINWLTLKRERNYLRKLGLHLDISPTCSWFILILALNNE